MSQKQVPFFANTPDDTHCYQASLKMILAYFLPDKEFSYEKLDEITAKQDGLWTSPTAGIISLHKMGFDMVDMDTFDLEQFIQQGGDYLISKYGKDVATIQMENINLAHEKKIDQEYLTYNIHQTRLPTLDTLKEYLDKGYLLICNVNACVLNNEDGFAGHFVVVFEYDAEGFVLHDPGLPPTSNRKVTYDQFRRAWEYPNEDSKNMLAFKYKQEE